MALTIKSLAAGKLGTSLADLYTCPADTATRITQIVLANTSTASNYAGTLKIQPASLGTTNAHYLIGAGTLVLAGGSVETPSNGLALMLAEGDKIQGNADTANVVDYVITGSEE